MATMDIDFEKRRFSSREIAYIIERLEQAQERGIIRSRHERNPYLLCSYRGVEGSGISPKWNVKVYTRKASKKQHSVVCVDPLVLRMLMDEDDAHFVPPDLPVISIDDAGWGFPACGVMVGVFDGQALRTAVVPVEYFRDDGSDGYHTKRYLEEYTARALDLLREIGASPDTHRIEICTGYINQDLRDRLRAMGYHVRVAEIAGVAQRELEEQYRLYVRGELGADLYYDPKLLDGATIKERYDEALTHAQQYFPEQVKTGWSSLGGRGG